MEICNCDNQRESLPEQFPTFIELIELFGVFLTADQIVIPEELKEIASGRTRIPSPRLWKRNCRK